jgi:ferredoxin-NADP reductase
MTSQQPTAWQGAVVIGIRPENPRAKTFRLRLESPVRHLAGQHYVVRLTAPDGYTASRSYSVASAPDDSGEIELTVERLPGGEVSGFLHDEVVVGDELEVRGPIGGWFVWPGDSEALLVGGGSGVVPLMSMLRQARAEGRPELLRLVVSVRSEADLLFRHELTGADVTVAHTRVAPVGWPRPVGRLGAADVPPPTGPDTPAYVCGSAGFADHATRLLEAAGYATGGIRAERFGPTS